MECERSPPLLLEEMVGERIEKYGLKFLEGEKRYSLTRTTATGATERVERALKLKMHPMSHPGNILYEHLRYYNKEGSERDIEITRFRAGEDWARIELWSSDGKPGYTGLSTVGDFTYFMEDIFKKTLIDHNKKEPQEYEYRSDYLIESKDIKFIAPACVDFIMEKYKSYMSYAKRQIELSESPS